MKTFILTWNRAESEEWGDREFEIDVTTLGYSVDSRWSTGGTKIIEAGDRLFLLQQGSCRGIVASGFATSEVFQDEHYSDPSKIANYVNLEWDRVESDDDMIQTEDLQRLIPNVHWTPIGGGIQIHSEADALALEFIWRYGVQAVDDYRKISWSVEIN